jgi:beta-lysine 5,6-aminomutase beta subunit
VKSVTVGQEAAQPIRPYGDRKEDGVVQMSFVLPVPPSARAKEAALQLVKKHGFAEVSIAHMERAGSSYTFFVVYAKTQQAVDFGAIDVPEVVLDKLGFDALNAAIERDLGRKIGVVGACTGTDAHAVGIDAIMNMKGYAGDYGLERYRMFDALNLGSQVDNAQLIDVALERNADAMLVSQIVTQRDVHKDNARDLVEKLEKKGLRQRFLLVLGGPRIDHKLALELGFDAGFGPGSKASDVANYLYGALKARAAKA